MRQFAMRSSSEASPGRVVLRFVSVCALLWPDLIAAFAVSCSVPSVSPRFSPEHKVPIVSPNALRNRNGQEGSLPTLASPPWSGCALVQVTPRGGMTKTRINSSQDDNNVTPKKLKLQKLAILVTSVAFVAWKRDLLLSSLRTLRNADLKSWLIGKLDAVNDLGTPGLVVYSFFFALWEILVGITTPVETAAGMAFGVKRGIIASAIGKIGGAITAYFIGHLLLQDYVKEKLEGNEMMDLVQDSIRENPVGVALIWRFSFLPEFVKNFGLSVLPIKPIHFITAVFLHGFPFTCLWTFLGAETGALARGVVAEPSRTLKILVSGVYVFGFFVSPTLVGMWVKSLKDKQKKKNA